MNFVEGPKNTVELMQKHALRHPVQVGLIAVNRMLERASQQTATLKSGEKMEIMPPETISNYIQLEGDYQPEVSFALRHVLQKDMVLWNIGAHIGLRVVQADSLVQNGGTIYAFEPTPITKKLLDTNAEGRTSEIYTFDTALGDRNGEIEFTDFGWLRSGSNTAASKPRLNPKWYKRIQPPDVFSVPIVTVDALVSTQGLKLPDVLIVDAEGLELPIFKGRTNTQLKQTYYYF